MPIGKFGEVIGTMKTFGDKEILYDSKVVAPKNPKLLRQRAPYVKLTPSEYLFQMSLNTKKKLQNTKTMELPDKVELLDMSNTTYQKTTNVSMEDPIFQPFPSSMTFVNCQPHETHELPLILRNNDKVPRLVKVTHEDSPYFQVISPPNVSHKVAAGLPIVFKIQFTPTQRQDYLLNLIVVTEREKFVVPVQCIGSRAILDFPDEIIFGTTPLKHNEVKTLFIRNIGNAVANFSISTKGPFKIEPHAAVLEINESMQLVVQFTPELPKEYSEEIIIHYDTGEDVYIKVYGSGQEIAIRLERSLVHINETYVGLANLRKVTLHNRSDIMVHFYWSNFSSQEAEDLDRETYLKILQIEEEEEQQRFQTDDDLKLLSSDKLSIVTRNYVNKKRMYKEKKSRYVDDNFTIDPIEGDIWPHTSLDITVAFKPTESRVYQSFAFCETTGRETRLSLKMTGIGIGPKVEFSFKTLDMGFIFIQAHHCYEIVFANKGDIDALFKIEAKASAVTRCFCFTPDDGLISPGSHQVIQIQFQSKEFLGEFHQEFQVKMDGCIEPSIISFKGIVIGPTFTFNVQKIKFGNVSVGFPSTQEVVLQNTSLVQLQYRLRVPTDGTADPLLAADMDNELSPREYCLQFQPREFHIDPQERTLDSMTMCTIAITLTANSIGKYHTCLILDVIGVGSEIYSLPITANAVVPKVELSSDILNFSRCFLNYPYEKSIKILNSSDLPVKYELVKQTDMTDHVMYCSSLDKAVVNPNSEFEVPITIKVFSIGEIRLDLELKVFGSNREPLNFCIACVGEGPVVNLNSVSLDWGIIKVLEDKIFTLHMSNESEIPAVFSTSMQKEQSVFRVEPSSGILQRHESFDLKVIAYLNDCVKFTDDLHIHIQNSKTKVVPLLAIGCGTTIDFDPPIYPLLDLGSHFSKTNLKQVFKVTNKGKRHQQLVWSNEGYSYTKALRQIGTKNEIPAPILTVVPHRFDLNPGESADLIINGFVDKPQVVHEHIMCHSIIGRQGGKELIKKVDLTVNFISPVLEFSERLLHFRLDKSLDTVFEILTKEISFTNVSRLSLNARLTVTYPFNILDEEQFSVTEKKLCLHANKMESVKIQFDPLYKTDFHSRTIEDYMKIYYDEHPHVDEIKLVGEVNFPNLHFDRTKIDFDCILNHSEVSQFVTMKNNSPLEVRYSWSLLIGDRPNIIFHRKRPILIEDIIEREIILDASDKDSNTEKQMIRDYNSECDNANETESVDRKLLASNQYQNEIRLELDMSENEAEHVENTEEDRVEKPPSKRLSIQSISKMSHQKPDIHENLKALLAADNEMIPLGIEEVFDVKPLYGTLKPEEFEQITFTYFGHSDIEAHVNAICEIEGGPTYRFEINGEASNVQYQFSSLNFNFDQVPYDQVVFKDMVLSNVGKVGFKFTCKNASAVLPDNQYPIAKPILSPISGYVEGNSEIIIRVGYLSGSPGQFSDQCQIQVAHFPMENIEISGQATFPRVIIDLPRDEGVVKESMNSEEDIMFLNKHLYNSEETFTEIVNKTRKELSERNILISDEEIIVYLENLAVANQPKKWDQSSLTKKPLKKGFDKPFLPAYYMDFGDVILGKVVFKAVKIKNTGHFPINMKVRKRTMQQSGFFMNLNQVKSLPCQQHFEFEISFDPRAANLDLGIVEQLLLLTINGGPTVPVRLIANVTMPDLRTSSEVVEFESVKLGEAKLITIQLHNPTPVVTEWTTLSSEYDNILRSRERVTAESLNIRKKKLKTKVEKKPLVFEMIPSAGELKPGQRINVQIKFMPLEEKSYTQRLIMMLSQSSKRIVVKCTGIGLEPKLIFKEGFIEFGPVLPFSSGAEKIINIRNPCEFPIEIYSLEFDKSYLEDEEMLRHISGYDSYGNLLMPPRAAGEKLPSEFIEYYEDLMKRKSEHELNLQKNNETIDVSEIELAENTVPSKRVSTQFLTKSTMSVTDSDSPAFDELEQTPVSQAIARYLGLELTPEGKAARRNRGIAIVVIGSPLSGKSDTAAKLASKYSAALLTVDDVILDALSNGTNPASQRARDLCLEAARRNEVFDMEDGPEKKFGLDGAQNPLPPGTKRSGVGNVAVHNMGQLSHNRKTSTVSTVIRHPSKQTSSKDHSADKTDGNIYVLSASPPPLSGPPVVKLNIQIQVSGDSVTLTNCILPDDVIIQILSERLMLNDCQQGIVFDGLESLFSQSQSCTAQLILHSLNNRRFLYFVTLKRDFKSMKDEEKEAEEESKALKEKQEQDELIWMQEMTEEEYEALDEQTKMKLEEKRLKERKEKKRQELEEKERQRQQQEEREAEMQRMKEEKSRQKGGKKTLQPILDDRVKSTTGKDTSMGRNTRESTFLNKENLVAHTEKHLSERPDSHMTEMSLDAEERKKKSRNLDKRSVGKIDELPKEFQETVEDQVKDIKKEQEWFLHQKFKTFDMENKSISEILTLWDRAHPPIKPSQLLGDHVDNAADDSATNTTTKRAGRSTGAKKAKEHAPSQVQQVTAPSHSPNHDETGENNLETTTTVQEELPGVPNIVIDVSKKSKMDRDEMIELCLVSELPNTEEVLEGLGLGLKGPPIPPPATFSIVQCPIKRRAPDLPEMLGESGHYNFLGTLEDKDEEKALKDILENEEEKAAEKIKEEIAVQQSLPKSSRSKDNEPNLKEKKDRKSSGKKSIISNSIRRGSQSAASLSSIPTPISDDGIKIQTYRWIIQPESEINLRLRFKSDELGQFDQTFNFEILNTRRKYQVFCRGICAFPNISKEPRIVFSHRQRNRDDKEIIQKKYIVDEEIYDFGPLLIQKDKQRIMANKFPENIEQIVIKNTSPLLAEINFCFLSDIKNERFELDPPTMSLKPGELQKLSIWAFPRVAQKFDDTIICCIKENPEPILFRISCLGVSPCVELDTKVFHFDKVLLHRKDMKSIYIRNSTALPIHWQLTGLESLGDEFSFAQDNGTVDPLTEFKLNGYFRAMKPYKANQKKNIRLEISDVNKLAGILQTETIQILAEAYDVALDMSFSKGANNGIDMGTLKVGDETKQTIVLKNRGPYEIEFKFELDSSENKKYNLNNLFTLNPSQGKMSPGEKAVQVQITYSAKEEVIIKDEQILKCHVIEPNIVEKGEIIAIIPIRISARSFYSKYQITPKADINFGSITVQTKKTRQIILENLGEFDFRFNIKIGKILPNPSGQTGGNKETGQKDLVPKSKQNESALVGGSQSRLQVGNFVLFPASAVIPAKNSIIITVDCVADNPGRCDENLIIDVTDKNPKLDPDGIQYRVFVEAFVPSIEASNLRSIFEEHRIVDTIELFHKDMYQLCSGGIYGKNENKFLFINVLVGSKVEARFRLDNIRNVPCDISLSLKPPHGGRSSMGSRGSASFGDIFEIDPPKAQIEPRGCLYACVVFSPLAMQQYTATFECCIEGLPQNSPYRSKALSFEVSGEGYLPRIVVTKPTLRNKKSQYLCLFKKSLIGRIQSQTVELYNDGALPCRVHVDVIDPDSSFWTSIGDNGESEPNVNSSRQPHDLVLSMEVGTRKSFEVSFRPRLTGRYFANIKITVVNNQYEDTIIQLIGEGYEDFITFENLPITQFASLPVAPSPVPEKSPSKSSSHPPVEEIIEAWKNNILNFGDCYVNEPKTISFLMVNHSDDASIRYMWPNVDSATNNQGNTVPVKFSPSVGHLHPGQSVSIMSTLYSTVQKTWTEKAVACKLVKINLADLEAGEKPLNWDDTKKTMKWIDVPNDKNGTGTITGCRKTKVMETEPEPKFTEVPETLRSLDLLLSANINYCKYKCKTTEINFQDTMVFETRTYGISFKNEGQIKMKYRWRVTLENNEIFTPRSSRPNTSRQYTDYKIEDDEDLNNPFTIEPHEGIIKCNDKIKFEVSFSPLGVDFFKASLVCDIENLDPSVAKPTISLSGRSLQPYCHFELTDSDYLISGRRDPTMRGPGGAPPANGINSNTRVIEIIVTGLNTRAIKSFYTINPTKNPLTYQWVCEDLTGPKNQTHIYCLGTKGVIEAGKKVQCGFQFTSQSVGISESFWRFEIAELGITVPFLIVGQCLEPNVTFDKSHFKFPPLLIGHESVESIGLMNFDNQSYDFAFQDNTRHAPGYSNSLRIEPMQGTVPANGCLQIHIGFLATTNQKLNFNIVCQVDKKTYPLTLNVKAEGYSVESSVWIEDSNGHSTELLPLMKTSEDQEVYNTINIGRMEVGEEQARWITLVNDGKFNYDFNWDLKWKDDPKISSMLTLSPVSGTVLIGEKVRCDLHIRANRATVFNKVIAMLSISYGSSYLLNIVTDIHRPIVEFSFDRFDFGHCFVYRAGMKPLTTELIIRNRDSKDSGQKPISIECLTESNDAIMHNFDATVLGPGATAKMEITFLPRKPKAYQQNIVFEINGMSRHSIVVTGFGEELRMEAIGLVNHTINLGWIKVGEKCNKTVTVANITHIPVTTKMVFSPVCEELQQKGVFKISPLGQDLKILPGRSNGVPIQISFMPTKRISKFTEEVFCETVGMTFPIFMITGACQGHDIRLDIESISFGLVTKGSQISKKLSMINYGDMGSKFKWNHEAFKPDFSISPVTGYISPGMEVVFDITFAPTKAAPDIRYDSLQCCIEGWKSLPLVLTGVCQNVTPVKETLHFNVPVRQQETKSLKIGNSTNATWLLKPIIEGEHWIGPETCVVEPQQTKNYEVTFRPLTMTSDGKKHQGSVFIAIPDGTGLLFNLTGTTEHPKVIAKINRELPSRTAYTEMLEIQNWLKRPQRFKVTKEILKPEKSESALQIKGFDYIDVTGGGSKQYKLTLTAQKEGVIQMKVTFTNESTGEYQFYEIQIKAFKPLSTAVIQLSTPVRQSVLHSIMLENTLGSVVNYQITSTSPEIHCTSQFQVQPQTKIPCTFEFFPLRVGETQAKLEISSPELSNISYDLGLVATPSRPEQPLIFNTCIGTCQTLLAHFKNWAKSKTDFVCKIDNAKFHCDKSITVAPNVDAQLEVNFEPSKLGECKALLTISNAVAGEFVFPLIGSSSVPKPQGPFTIKPGSTISLNFRNVFPETTLFYFQLDNSEFHINKPSESIRSHKDYRIVIGYDGSSDGGPSLGKLVVTCPETDSSLNKLQWVYYLKGIQKE